MGAARALAGPPQKVAGGVVRPGEVWLDDRGKEIQAHGGGILHQGDTYFWYGEDRSPDLPSNQRAVACYSSRDLVHWSYRGRVLTLGDPEDFGFTVVLERPKVFFNAATKKYVMYMHLDGPKYKLARVAVATSDKADGPFTYVRSFRPLRQESRDIGQFVDDDGSAYLIFEARPSGGFYIAQLSEDYLSVTKQMSFVHAPLEGGAIVHFQGTYYVMGSHLTGWKANPNVYATSSSLAGPWSEMKDIAPPETNTYGTQSTMLLKVAGTKTTSVIYMGDKWTPGTLWDSRYVWMPLEMGPDTMQLPEPQPWSINLRTGETHVFKD